jgi:O-antigen ligase
MYKRNISKIMNILITLTMSITPLILVPFHIYIPIVNKYIVDYYMYPKLLFLYIIVLAMSLVLAHYEIKQKLTSIKTKDLTEKILMVYISLLVLSTVFSVNPYRSLKGELLYEEGLITILLYIFLFIVSKHYFSYSEKYVKLILISSTIIGLYGAFQYLGLDPIITEMTGTIYATFRNPNYFGTYLVLIIPISLFHYIRTNNKFYMIVTALLYFCLLATKTRGAWLGYFSSMLVFLYYAKQNKNYRKRFIVILAVLGFITIFYNILSENSFITRIVSIFADIESIVGQAVDYEKAGSSRIYIWKGVLKIIKENPILGTGIETFSIVFKQKSPPYFFKAHNEYLNIAQSTGIPSLIVYLVWLCVVIRAGIKATQQKAVALPILASVIGYSVQAFFNVSVVAVAYIFWIFCGIMVNFSDDSLREKNNSTL